VVDSARCACGLPRQLRCDRTMYLRVVNWLLDMLEGDHGYEDPKSGGRAKGHARLLPLCCCGCLSIVALLAVVVYGGGAVLGAVGAVIAAMSSAIGFAPSAISAAVVELPGAAVDAFTNFDWSTTLMALLGWLSDTGTWLWTGNFPCTPSPGSPCPVVPDAETCPDGILIPGPLRTPVNSAITLGVLFWLFYGVSIGADLFMESIEEITSQEALTFLPMPGGKRRPLTVQVWNATVANLTLMALGSSAPEILLSVIEICGNKFYSGELGPSTIVGSAAFNLMVISAVCVTAIPDGEGRLIKQLSVFGITAVFSIFAYLWLAMILLYISPNVIDIWEGLLTLAFFPLMVGLAYVADTGKISFVGRQPSAVKVADQAAISAKNRRRVEVVGGGGIQAAQTHSAAYYRMHATRTATGFSPTDKREELKLKRETNETAARAKRGGSKAGAGYLSSTATSKARRDQTVEGTDATIELGASHFAARDTDGWAEVAVFRSGSLAAMSSVSYVVILGAAAGDAVHEGDLTDIIAAEGRLTFEPTQQRATLRIQLLKDDVRQANGGDGGSEGVAFSVRLKDPSTHSSLGPMTECAVRVIGGDDPGVLCLEDTELRVRENDGYAILTITREDGAHGEVSCVVNTKDGRAVAPADYEAIEGEVVTFAEGETSKQVRITIHNDDQFEGDEEFFVIVSEATGGATFALECDGGPERAVVKVIIQCDDAAGARSIDACLVRIGMNQDFLQQVGLDWCHQFEDAFALDGECSLGHLAFYVFALPWRLAFAFMPPLRLFGGWACFVAALAMIGAITAFVGDYASNLGCCFGISKSITAITFVALGTSLPDTFASRTAALSEPHADNSLGNITGSNSVNVFLGLGLPWGIAAIYWWATGTANEAAWRARYEGEAWYDPSAPVAFAVPAGSLGYSVMVFLGCAVTTILTLVLRRATLGYELGGPSMWAQVTAIFFVGLWLLYIVLSILREL